MDCHAKFKNFARNDEVKSCNDNIMRHCERSEAIHNTQIHNLSFVMS
ncbi:hypothetical protein [Helicobacter fennelliae]|nr:hypothetical protein [Helicobacter fennelliae]